MDQRSGEGMRARRQKKDRAAGTHARDSPGKAREAPDYHVWHYTFGQVATSTGLYLALDGVVSFLFFRSWIAFLILAPGVALYLSRHRRRLILERRLFLETQFLTGMQLVSTALQAGYAMENTFAQALPQLEKIYGSQEMIPLEFARIAALVRLNEPVEKLLSDLGARSGSEDIQSFAEVFSVAKRTGGDITAIIRNTVSCIRQKNETRQEIETALSGKVLEQNIMSMIPLVILGYVNLTSPGFLDVMYHNTAGIAIMSACLAVWAGAFAWGRAIVQIHV